VFSAARFVTHEELRQLAADAGLAERATCSALLTGPTETPATKVVDGVAPGAGFVAAAFRREP